MFMFSGGLLVISFNEKTIIEFHGYPINVFCEFYVSYFFIGIGINKNKDVFGIITDELGIFVL